RSPPTDRRSGPCAARAGGSGPRDVLLAPDARTLLDGGRRALARRALERLVEHLVHRLDEAELERAAHVFRDVLEVRLVAARQDAAERRLRRLLHDVAEAAREREALLPRHARRLDEEDVAAVRRPGEADGYPGILRPLRHLGEEALRPEVLADLVGGAHDGLGPPLGDGARHLPADPPDLSLQVAEPRLARVAADDPRQRLVLEAQVVGREPVLAQLLRDQVAAGDLELLLLGVAGELDDLHAIAE